MSTHLDPNIAPTPQVEIQPQVGIGKQITEIGKAFGHFFLRLDTTSLNQVGKSICDLATAIFKSPPPKVSENGEGVNHRGISQNGIAHSLRTALRTITQSENMPTTGDTRTGGSPHNHTV